MNQIQQIPVEKIQRGNNDRKHFNGNALRELADSIRENGHGIEGQGLAQPPTYRPLPNGMYEIVAGERRTLAMRDILGWAFIPAIVREMDDEEASAIMLIENTSRVDLNPIEEAQAFQKRCDEGWTIAILAQKSGKSEGFIRDRIALLNLVDEIQHMVAFAQLPLGHAGLLSGLDANRQRIAIKVYNASNNMPLSKFRDIVNELLAEQKQDTLFDLGELMVENAKKEAEMPVSLRGKNARTGAPSRKDLPPVRVSSKDGINNIMDRYIADLIANGHTDEAGVLGTLYNTLVASNWMSIPSSSSLDTKTSESAGILAHSTKLD